MAELEMGQDLPFSLPALCLGPACKSFHLTPGPHLWVGIDLLLFTDVETEAGRLREPSQGQDTMKGQSGSSNTDLSDPKP